jgi:glyoxylase-like metal-dependent hydrolase (beta-lactamase superfamily II)
VFATPAILKKQRTIKIKNMKKIVKRVLLASGIVVVLIGLFFGWYMIKAKSEIKKMTPVETKEITDNIFAIKDSFSDIYLIKDSNSYIAIDAGNDIAIVAQELKKLNINPDNVIAVILTHTDGDHIASIQLFKNARVYLSKQEAQLINGEKSRFLFFGNKIDAKEYTLIDDQQVFRIGNVKIKGYLTEGHTPGSMCYFVNDKYLFTGDALSLKDGRIDTFNDFFNMDSKTATKSIDRITSIPEAAYIFTAHYGYSNNYKNAVKDWVPSGN